MGKGMDSAKALRQEHVSVRNCDEASGAGEQ